MSSKSYTGTIEIGSNTYLVRAVIAKKGRQLLGSILPAADETKEIPVNFRLSPSMTSFSSLGVQWFQSPAEEAIALLSVGSGFTSIALDLSTITITDSPIEIDGVNALLSLSLDEVLEISEIQGLESEAEVLKTIVSGTLVPTRVNQIGNHLDHFADLLSIRRIYKEVNEQLLDRIENRIARPTGSSEIGLSEAIPNSLGLLNTDVITVKLKEDPADDPTKIAFVLNKEFLVLYREWFSLELQNKGAVPIEEFRVRLSGLSLGLLVDKINESENFSAKLIADSDLTCEFLIPCSSIKFTTETLGSSEKIKLSGKNLLKGMLSIENSKGIAREVSSANDLVRRGDYFIDYEEGVIRCFSSFQDNITVAYLCNSDEFDLRVSPVYLLPLNGEASNEKNFNQVSQVFYQNEEDKNVNGIPTDIGYNVIRKIMTAGKFPQFWGE